MSRHRRRHGGQPPTAQALPRSGPIYWCEATAYTHDRQHSYWLGFHPARSPRLALRWLHARADDLATQLDQDAATPIRGWLSSPQEHERALTALANGQPYTFLAYDDEALYFLSATRTHAH